MKTKGVLFFLAITFSVAWIPLGIQRLLGLQSPGEQATLVDDIIFTLLTLPTSFSPAIGALIVRKWVTREGFADAGLRLYFRKSWPYYLCALCYPLVVVPVALFLAWVSQAGTPDFSAIRAGSLLQMVLLSLISTPVIWGEEFGWRGYLQIRLFAGKPALAAIATGVIWGIWHYPMILMGFLFSGNPLGLALYPVNMIFTSILYGWLMARSGSVWTASLAHAMGNSLLNPLLQSLLPGVGWPLVWAGFRMAGLVLICVWILLKGRFFPAEQTIRTQFEKSSIL